MSFLRVAVVQQQGNPGKPDENRDKAVAFARTALERGADLVLFHEELTLGYTPDSGNSPSRWTDPPPRPSRLCSAAARRLLAELWDEEGVIAAEVDSARALALRAGNPWYRGRRPELYYRKPTQTGST